MNQYDPEKRIAELERQLAEAKAGNGGPGGWLTPEQVRNVAFSKPPAGYRGYNEDEVDAFLDYVAAALRDPLGRTLTPEQVRNTAFSRPPIGKRGYNEDEVDAFLDRLEGQLKSTPGAFPPAATGPWPGSQVSSFQTGGRRPRARKASRTWIWWLIFVAVLYGLQAGLPHLHHVAPALNRPAPSWMGLLFLLGIPGFMIVGYIVSRLNARRRARRWGAGSGGGGDGSGGCGGGSNCGGGHGGGHGGCGGGHGGCGGGSGCGGGGCGGGGH